MGLNKTTYQFFGSENSLDLDVCFFVEQLGTIEENKNQLKQILALFQFNTQKSINGNLALLNDGRIESCFKGLKDELNNALLETYDLHRQDFPLRIVSKIDRDINGKVARCMRVVVSYFTRTPLRLLAKSALKGNIDDQIAFLLDVDFNSVNDFGKNGTTKDVLKSIAFQLGQTRALLEGVELFSKSDVSLRYEDLRLYLERVDSDRKSLDSFKIEFVKRIKLYQYDQNGTRKIN